MLRGDHDAIRAWKDLANLLLHATVASATEGVRLTTFAHAKPGEVCALLDGFNDRPVRLTNGKFLRVRQTLCIAAASEGVGPRVKVLAASYQYQHDVDGKDWLFRYDYERKPKNQYPGAHFQIEGTVDPSWLPGSKSLHDIHFPTNRISIESVLRLLIEDFGVPNVRPTAVWRGALSESDRLFREIAHAPSPGPDV